MTKLNGIFIKVLDNIRPTSQELTLIKTINEKLINILRKTALELGISYTQIEPQGSTGIKQTQLRTDFDIDLFIGLDYELYKHKYKGLSKNKLKKKSKKDFLKLCNNWIIKSLTSKEFYKPRLLYAEHPYVTVDYIFDNFKIKIDIVLYFDLDLDYIKKFGPITAVDRSPWHGRFIRDTLTAEQKDDIRLLKQFFKASHCYGDKSAVGKVGFIGYSAELLIYYFNNLQNLLSRFNELRNNPLDYYGRSSKKLREILHFQQDYLILIDPIDKNRNVASSISGRAYEYCNFRIQQFLKNPKEEFFKIKPIPLANLLKIENEHLLKIFIVELKNLDKDIHYTINRDKLYSLAERIKVKGEKEYSHNDRFKEIEYEVYFEDTINEYNIVFYCETPKISKTFTRKGPPLSEKKHCIKFMEKNPNYFKKDEYLWVETKREYHLFIKFLSEFIRNNIPDNFQITNLSKAENVKTSSGKKAIYILLNFILPFV
jgi:tRNA nucleotidyltransferase (CCA-adding enzyme)